MTMPKNIKINLTTDTLNKNMSDKSSQISFRAITHWLRSSKHHFEEGIELAEKRLWSNQIWLPGDDPEARPVKFLDYLEKFNWIIRHEMHLDPELLDVVKLAAVEKQKQNLIKICGVLCHLINSYSMRPEHYSVNLCQIMIRSLGMNTQ